MQRATLSRMPLRAALVLALAVAGAGIAPAPEPTLHACAGAGQWFPADPTELRDTVARYLDAARPPELDGNLRALVVPHAGYPYSGPTAAVAYRLLRGRSFHRVIILAISHRYPIDGASVLDVAGYQTPLGTVEVDREAVHALLKNNAFTTVEAAHRSEHSDENQLPFLQCALGDFQLVSILVGDNGVGDPRVSERKFAALAAALRPWIDARTLLVVSSDFTHYGQPYGYTPFRRNTKENLRALDGEAASYLIARDAGGFEQYLQRTQATICGRAPLALLLRLLPPDTRGAFLHYDRSGDGAAASLPSVGYMALAFVSDASPPAPPDWIRPAGARVQLSTPECRTLLRLAHDSIAARWDASHRLHGSDYELTPGIDEFADGAGAPAHGAVNGQSLCCRDYRAGCGLFPSGLSAQGVVDCGLYAGRRLLRLCSERVVPDGP